LSDATADAVSGSEDNALKVWELETGREIRTLEGHIGAVRSVCLTPDGRRVVSGSDDGTLKVWDLETGKLIAVFTADGPILAVAVAQNGMTIVAGEKSARIHFLRPENFDAQRWQKI
jgi:WD40 repeat protein